MADIALWPYAENRIWFHAIWHLVPMFLDEDSHDEEVFIPVEVIHRMHK